MGRITSNLGLITGLDITGTVDKLIAIQARSRDALVTRNKALDQQKAAVAQITASLIALQLTTNRFAAASLYDGRSVSSSDDALLSAISTGTPDVGQYQFTPIQQAQSQQLQSTRFASDSTPLGAGTFSFRYGGYIDTAADLDLLGGGEGFARGRIRITDRSGATADIDLNYARNVDDVLAAINGQSTANVVASVSGDRLKLTDKTGLTTSNLKVAELGGGTTAASLGLAGIDVAVNSATGQDVVSLFDELSLDKLNGGNGVRFDSVLSDLRVSFRDGTQADIDFHKMGTAGTKVTATTSAINGANAKVKFTAVTPGSAAAGTQISFVNDNAITAGNETAVYDAQAETLVFHIDSGSTTADHIVAALGRTPAAAAVFTATRGTAADGSGLVNVNDTGITVGPQATATTPGTASNEAKLLFTAVQGGTGFDNVEIKFVNNNSITAGSETVVYDDSNPLQKTLTFQIDQGNTTANQIIAALNNDPTASQIFTAANLPGSSGVGAIHVGDTATTSGGAIVEPQTATSEASIGDILATLNAASPGKLHAEIAADGDRIVLTDLTSDTGGTFSVVDLNDSHVVADLGLTPAASGATLSGKRILAGLKTSLLSTLNGGAGLSNLGQINLTDRSGASATVNLAAAETLDDVLDAINAAGLNISASINAARNGIELNDSTSVPSGNLIVANGDGTTTTADRLGLTANLATSTKNGGNLRLQVVGLNTKLASLNGGAGVSQSTLKITDTAGNTGTLTIGSSVKTIGDVIDAIGHLGLSLQARINDAGDGITLIDTAHGSGQIVVAEGNGTAAKDLHLLGTSTEQTINAVATQVLDGSTTYTVTLDATTTLKDLVAKINDLGSSARASIFNDGSSVKPFRFTLFNQRTGKAGELQIDASQAGFALEQTVAAKDALLLLGSPGSTTGVLASSSTNTFANVISGVSLSVKGASNTAVTVSIGTSNDKISSALGDLVVNYNKLHDKLVALTKFDEGTGQSAVLQGDGAALRVQSDLSNLVTGRLFGASGIQSLAELGVGVNDDGSLTFDDTKFQTRYAQSSQGIKDFLSKADAGISDRFKKMIDQLAGAGHSLLIDRAKALDAKSATNAERITFLNLRLEAQRERLTLQFHRSELAISKIRNSLDAINAIVPLSYNNSNSN